MDPNVWNALPAFIQLLIIVSVVASAAWVVVTKVIRPIANAVMAIHGTWEMVREDHARIAKVEKRSNELVNNSGSSLRDAVDRIEAGQKANSKALADHIEWGQGELLKVWQAMAHKEGV